MSDVISALIAIVGDLNVLSGDQSRAAYDIDISGYYKGISLAVVRPGNTKEVSEVMKLAHQNRIAVVAMGGNTGLTGATCPGGDGDKIILSLARLNQISNINPESRTAHAGAGVILQNMHDAVAEHDLVFPLFFGARGSAMIGGVLSTNAGGSNVLRYGNTRALILGVEVVLADGRVLNLMSELAKDNTGYDLKDLFIGAEGTLGIITGAVLKLFPKPRAYATALLAMNTLAPALNLLRELQDQSGDAVEAFEFMPLSYIDGYKRVFPDHTVPLAAPGPVNILLEIGAASALLLREDDTGRATVHGLLEETLGGAIEAGIITDAVIAQNDSQREQLWHIRESAYEVSMADGPSVDCDVSVPLPDVEVFLGEMARRLPDLCPGGKVHVVAHLGDGNLHYSVAPPGNENGVPDALKQAISAEVEDVVQSLSGSFSAEHGIGLSKLATMARRKDPVALSVMGEVKRALDEYNLMNPGKVLPG